MRAAAIVLSLALVGGLLVALRSRGLSQLRTFASNPLILATVALWVAVGHWNAYFDALIYITDSAKIVLQVILRRILLEDMMDYVVGGPTEIPGQSRPTGEVVKAAIIMLSTLPIIMVYPFLQRYFVKGVMIGAIKG